MESQTDRPDMCKIHILIIAGLTVFGVCILFLFLRVYARRYIRQRGSGRVAERQRPGEKKNRERAHNSVAFE